MRGLARAISWFDRYIIDALINLIGVWTLRGAQRARRLQTGRAGDYVYAVLLGAIVLAAWSAVGAA